jgi:hypothetical protein
VSPSTRKAALKRLDKFIGDWSVKASFPDSPTGRSVFEWALKGQYLIQRSEAPDPIPQALAIVAVDPKTGAYTQHYFDSRGVVRVYAMTFSGDSWTLTRNSPDFSPLDFHQRFKGRFIDGGNTIQGTWEQSQDGRNWKRDFDLTYTKVKRPRASRTTRSRQHRRATPPSPARAPRR